MYRVRQLIPYLNYSNLRKQKILPVKPLFTRVAKGGKFGTLSQKVGYSDFGLFMEIILQEAIICNHEPLEELFEGCKCHLPEETHKHFKPKEFVFVGELVREHFKDQIPEFEPEWAVPVDGIVGHPDIVSNDCVYDVKTTGRFNAMRTQTIFQILSYYCLAKIKGHETINHVGLILPCQNKIFKVNLESWDWKPFWNSLKKCITIQEERKKLYEMPFEKYLVFSEQKMNVGHTIKKYYLEKALKQYNPIQFFLGGNASTKVTTISKKLTNQLKNRHYPHIFIHAPYSLNLSRPAGKHEREEDKKLDIPWTCYITREILNTGNKAGINGVVIHCGRKAEMEEKIAIDNMRESLYHILEHFPEDSVCPLLLETSSGQNGELLCSPHELADFYNSISEKPRENLKVCVDSCHMFASGYDPMEYIKILENKNIPIALIHYNDSKHEKGSKIDRHEPIGRGCIGIQSLFEVLMWANSKNIALVYE